VEGDAEALPFADQSFDAVLSCFGAMFAQDQERAVSEMVRVCRRGGRVALANWTPDGFIGQLFEVLAEFVPASRGRRACSWGTCHRLQELFGVYGTIHNCRKYVPFRARTAAHWVDKLQAGHASVGRAFALLDASGRKSLRGRLLDLVARFNTATDATLRVDAAYLEVVVLRR
jgi:SAM-dependent methyltransferase